MPKISNIIIEGEISEILETFTSPCAEVVREDESCAMCGRDDLVVFRDQRGEYLEDHLTLDGRSCHYDVPGLAPETTVH